MSDRRNIALREELVKLAREKFALDPQTMKMLLAGGAGAIGVGVPAALLTHAHDQRQNEQTKNRAFGAGLASGLAGPEILRGLYNIANPNPGYGS